MAKKSPEKKSPTVKRKRLPSSAKDRELLRALADTFGPAEIDDPPRKVWQVVKDSKIESVVLVFATRVDLARERWEGRLRGRFPATKIRNVDYPANVGSFSSGGGAVLVRISWVHRG